MSKLAAFALGLMLGAGTLYLVLRASTQGFEDRAQRAEAQVGILRGWADLTLADADSIAREVTRLRTRSRPVEPVAPRVQRIIETVPDSQAVDSLARMVAELDTALRDTTALLHLQDDEITALRETVGSLTAALDTATSALASRPSVMVTWDWRPKLSGQVFGRYETRGSCVGAGPALEVWRVQARAYGAMCTPDLAVLEPQLTAGVEVRVTVF